MMVVSRQFFNLIKLTFSGHIPPETALFVLVVMVKLSGTVCQISSELKLIICDNRPLHFDLVDIFQVIFLHETVYFVS